MVENDAQAGDDAAVDRLVPWLLGIAGALVVALIVWGIAVVIQDTSIRLLVGAAFVVALAVVAILVISSNRAQRRSERLTTEASELQAQLDENFFTALVKLNYKYLDKYYLQTQVQAKRSFTLSAAAAGVAFGLVVAGIVLLYSQSSRSGPGATVWSAEKFAGIVATIAGILSQFVAAIFFYLYNATIAKMAEYHQKLVLTQNLGLALRIADGLKDEAAKLRVQETLVKYLAENINAFLTGSRPPKRDA